MLILNCSTAPELAHTREAMNNGRASKERKCAVHTFFRTQNAGTGSTTATCSDPVVVPSGRIYIFLLCGSQNGNPRLLLSSLAYTSSELGYREMEPRIAKERTVNLRWYFTPQSSLRRARDLSLNASESFIEALLWGLVSGRWRNEGRELSEELQNKPFTWDYNSSKKGTRCPSFFKDLIERCLRKFLQPTPPSLYRTSFSSTKAHWPSLVIIQAICLRVVASGFGGSPATRYQILYYGGRNRGCPSAFLEGAARGFAKTTGIFSPAGVLGEVKALDSTADSGADSARDSDARIGPRIVILKNRRESQFLLRRRNSTESDLRIGINPNLTLSCGISCRLLSGPNSLEARCMVLEEYLRTSRARLCREESQGITCSVEKKETREQGRPQMTMSRNIGNYY
ncbi:hypothetical protein B0H14DRAFT_3166895 [Mycena olivaceomarginata]|nr:hypothetical protein B0H14DRAFT_3166895 [Mycena olivaceomarginata]